MTALHSRRYLDGSKGARLEALCIPEPNSGCWLWVGAVKANGYGNFFLDGRFTQAHRASYVVFVGPIPTGLVVRHKCDNVACVNPQHLELGTQAQNVRDAIDRNRRKPFNRKHAGNKSGVVGVTWARQQSKWKVSFGRRHLGYFDTLDAASTARREAEGAAT